MGAFGWVSATLLLTGVTLPFGAVACAGTIGSVASGEGRDRESALQSALRRAVEQVVGVTVNSTTVVENYQVIQDRIFTAAAGFVRSYDVGSSPNSWCNFRSPSFGMTGWFRPRASWVPPWGFLPATRG